MILKFLPHLSEANEFYSFYVYLEMTQLVEILPLGNQETTHLAMSMLAVDDWVTQGIRASTAMVLN